MAVLVKKPLPPHFDELRRLFYLYRLAHLNSRYHSCKLSRFEFWEKGLQLFIAIATALSFGLLSISLLVQPSYSKTIAAIAACSSLLAFLAATAMPYFEIGKKLNNCRDRHLAWSFAVQQIENAMRFTKAHESSDGEIAGYARAAIEAYERAAALPTETEDQKLVKRLEVQIRQAFPSKYVWTAL